MNPSNIIWAIGNIILTIYLWHHVHADFRVLAGVVGLCFCFTLGVSFASAFDRLGTK